MSNEKMFFGTLYDKFIPGNSSTTVNAKMSLVPAPDPGMEAAFSGYYESLIFENGGADSVDGGGRRRSYAMTWNSRQASGAQGLDLITAYFQKYFGPGLIYFADPMNYTQNILSPQWASPGLMEQGWKPIGGFNSFGTGVGYSFSTTGTTLYNQPRRSATFTTTATFMGIDAIPTVANQMMVVPIPPDRTLWLGFSGSLTGNGVLRVRPINQDGSYAATTDLTMLSASAATRLNASFSGATYKAVEIYITRSGASGTVTITSGMAQLWPIGVTPVLTGSHILGSGANGCKFDSDAVVENYSFADMMNSARLYKGMAIALVEAGPWAKTGT